MVTARSAATFASTLIAVALPLAVFASPGPEVKSQDSVSYLTGGVGSDERAAIKAKVKQFNLELAIATKKGHFLGDGAVNIADAQGHTVLQVTMDGPLFYAHLQPGTYTVKVNRDGTAKQQTVEVPSSGQRSVIFRWSSD